MSENMSEITINRRMVLAGGAIALASALTGKVAIAQPEIANGDLGLKQVRQQVAERELVQWTQDFLRSLNAKLPLIECFELAGGNTTNEFLRTFSKNAPDILLKGYILSDFMEMNRHIFNRDYVTTVRYGEIYGELDMALEKWLKDRPKRD